MAIVDFTQRRRPEPQITIEQIKSNFSIIEEAEKYTELIRVNNNTFKARDNFLRDELHSSLFFYVDSNSGFDFGTGEKISNIDMRMKTQNFSLSESINSFKDNSTIEIQNYTPRPQKKEVGVYDDVSEVQLNKEFDYFEKLTFSNINHKRELLATTTLWLCREANEKDLEFFLSLTRYDSKNNILVMKWCENSILDLLIVTYKRRRFNSGKWVNRSNTHPNNTIFYRIVKNNSKIYILEGARDALNAILLGIDFIAIPSTSFSNYKAIKECIKPKDELIYLCEDLQGYRAMSKIQEHINGKLVCLAIRKDEKIDLSDFIVKCKNKNEVLNAIK